MKFKTIIVCSSLLLLSSTAMADTTADNAIKFRKNLMNSTKTSVDALIAAVKGEVDQKDNLEALAAVFAAATNPEITKSAFLQNTHDQQDKEKTTATEKIWSDWNDFAEAFDKLGAATQEISAQAAAGTLTSFDQLKPALGQCGYCHRKAGYRVKQ